MNTTDMLTLPIMLAMRIQCNYFMFVFLVKDGLLEGCFIGYFIMVPGTMKVLLHANIFTIFCCNRNSQIKHEKKKHAMSVFPQDRTLLKV